MRNHRNTPRTAPPLAVPTLADPVGALAACEAMALRNQVAGVRLGLGLMGLVGWSVAVPTLLGAALGLWLDQLFPGARLWTLTLLVVGLGLGCMNAWNWISREDMAMRDGQDGGEDDE